MNDVRERRSTNEIKKPSLRTVGLALLLVASSVFGGIAYFALAATSPGGTPTVTTLGNQERQDITAANQWVEGNIDFWLESHLYDAEVRFDAGSSGATIPNAVDVSMSFFFAEKNAIVIDWTQDWFVTLKGNVMFYSKTSVPPGGGLFKCSTPPNIVTIPKGGSSIMVPQAGSICISDVKGLSNPDPNLGWTSLMSLPLADLNKTLPKRNEPCSTVVNGLCSSGAELESSPATDHYFRVSFVDLFGPSGKYPQSWWPNLPAGKSLAIYFRSHLALTGIWKTAIGGPGGGSQSEFCITTGPGAIRNTNPSTYNRCSWTTVSREGAGGAQGSKNHGTLFAPGIGAKTIPLPQVVSPTGFITVCKIVTLVETDRTGAFGSLTNGWTVHVEGPFGTSPDPSNPIGVILTLSQAQSGSGPTVTFVNFPPRPILKLSEFGYTNTPTGTPIHGVTSGVTVYTVKMTNYGSADATLSGSLTVTVSDTTGGSFACTASSGPGSSLSGCTLTFDGVSVPIGATVTYTLTLEYTTLPTGSIVAASLAASYVLSGSNQSFVPSGVPAQIRFTIQGG